MRGGEIKRKKDARVDTQKKHGVEPKTGNRPPLHLRLFYMVKGNSSRYERQCNHASAIAIIYLSTFRPGQDINDYAGDMIRRAMQ